MADSLIQLTEEEIFEAEVETLILPVAATSKLSPSQIENMKTAVVMANQAMTTAGNAIKSTCAALYDIKIDVKKKNWVALTDAGVLNMSGRMARDLVGAYEQWLSNSDIPDSALARVSSRTLFKIGKAPTAARNKAINEIKKGKGFSELDLKKLIKPKTKPKKNIENLIKNAQLASKGMSEKEIRLQYEKLIVEKIKLEEEVNVLKSRLSKIKK